jgi:hypothetical protein
MILARLLPFVASRLRRADPAAARHRLLAGVPCWRLDWTIRFEVAGVERGEDGPAVERSLASTVTLQGSLELRQPPAAEHRRLTTTAGRGRGRRRLPPLQWQTLSPGDGAERGFGALQQPVGCQVKLVRTQRRVGPGGGEDGANVTTSVEADDVAQLLVFGWLELDPTTQTYDLQLSILDNCSERPLRLCTETSAGGAPAGGREVTRRRASLYPLVLGACASTSWKRNALVVAGQPLPRDAQRLTLELREPLDELSREWCPPGWFRREPAEREVQISCTLARSA